MIPKTIHSNRLIIVMLQPKDALATYQIWSDPIVTEYMNIEPFRKISQSEEMIAFFEDCFYKSKAVRYGIFYQERCIGTCGFNEINWRTGTTEIGYELAHAYWRQGFGTEIIESLCTVAFKQLRLKKIQAKVDQQNLASQKLLVKQGFQLASTLENQLLEYQKLNSE